VAILSHNELEDKISLVLVPLLASAGLRILKFIQSDEISGQALLDNLFSIPGVSLPSNPEDIHRLLERTGGVYAQVPGFSYLLDKAPTPSALDKMGRFKVLSLFAIYAVPWKGIAVDVRVGGYPLQTKTPNARDLAEDLKEHCDAAGMGFSFFISNQNQPLGHALGPVLELQESLDVLKAKGPLDLTKIALELGADLLMFAGKFFHRTEAKSFLKNLLISGAAYSRFREIIQAQKSEEVAEKTLFPYPPATQESRIVSRRKGYINRIAMDRIIDLKQRLCREDRSAGFLLLKKIGDITDINETVVRAYLPQSWDTKLIQTEIQDIFTLSRTPPEFQPQIKEKIKGRFRF
jgi:pyrimidine-nucleoside phosphorylase